MEKNPDEARCQIIIFSRATCAVVSHLTQIAQPAGSADRERRDVGHQRPQGRGHTTWQDLLGTRHDPKRWRGSFGNSYPPYGPDRPDRLDRGNAAFVDGHVEYVTREYTWD